MESASTSPHSVNHVFDPLIDKWNRFVVELDSMSTKIPKPYPVVDILSKKYLSNINSEILDIGCETGKNAASLLQDGHRVHILDIAPKAIEITVSNLEKLNLIKGVTSKILGKIEDLDPKIGPFNAVVGTYAFAFIHPNEFNEVMKQNVLGRVNDNGYFAGGFFGKEHIWSKNSNLTFVDSEFLHNLFSSEGFCICELYEEKKMVKTVWEGEQLFHTIAVIAQKNYKIEK
ncbi:MAG: hypothetical protein Tsb0021_05660 [Chlamydiales bacterium]